MFWSEVFGGAAPAQQAGGPGPYYFGPLAGYEREAAAAAAARPDDATPDAAAAAAGNKPKSPTEIKQAWKAGLRESDESLFAHQALCGPPAQSPTYSKSFLCPGTMEEMIHRWK